MYARLTLRQSGTYIATSDVAANQKYTLRHSCGVLLEIWLVSIYLA